MFISISQALFPIETRKRKRVLMEADLKEYLPLPPSKVSFIPSMKVKEYLPPTKGGSCIKV
jgi:hypothetical protein